LWLKGGRTPDNHKYWNPLRDDGDALRLAVKLRLDVDIEGETAWAFNGLPGAAGTFEISIEAQDIYAATRRAIVRAAAARGEKP
jgi:hypothetical protein